MNLLDNDKLTVLLELLKFHAAEIQRREQREQQIFEWCVALMLAAFGAIIALSGSDNPPENPFQVQILATVLISVPTLTLAIKMLRYNERSKENAVVIDNIEAALNLFQSPKPDSSTQEPHPVSSETVADVDILQIYPYDWKNSRAKLRKKRATQWVYFSVLLIMATVVITTVWVALPSKKAPESKEQKSSPIAEAKRKN